MWKLSNFVVSKLRGHVGKPAFWRNSQLFQRKSLCTMSATDKPRQDFQNHRLVWVDLEMSGLNVDDDHILEVACVITDANLNLVAKGPNLVVHQPDVVLESMNDWCKQHHGQSGLTQAVRDSKVSLEEAERQVLEFVSQHTPLGKCPLAGNSVHEDKRFLAKYMPQFMGHLHYRIVDVSTVKEICRRWFPEEFALAPRKQAAHRALDDILESIKELQYYRRTIFRNSTAPT